MTKVWEPAFDYHGVPFDGGSWQMEELATDAAQRVVVYTAPDGRLQLHLTIREYPEFGIVEWYPELTGCGTEPSELIENFHSLALTVALPAETTVRIRRSYGTVNRDDDFRPDTVRLGSAGHDASLRMTTGEGRSSAAWLPFFSVDTGAEGWNVGIGWSGAWTAEFSVGGGQLKLTAGMRHTRFRLNLGETLRQPSILLQRFTDADDARRRLRRFLLTHHTPRNSAGIPFPVPISCMAWGGMSTETMLGMIAEVHKQQMPFDTFWVDAGWYGPDRDVSDCEMSGTSDWWTTVGDWRINRKIHPGGFRPVSDAAHRAGMKFLLWFELERVTPAAPVYTEHPEWLLTLPGQQDRLLDLGNPEACDWALETVSSLIVSEGIDCFRLDFNINTLPYWEHADAPERQGVSEAKHIAGLYRLWDELRRRFPDLLIDNCASGGRRIDFETMSRSLCLWRVDGFRDDEVKQFGMRHLSAWVPLHAGTAKLEPEDEYAFLSGVAAGTSWAACLCLYAYQPTAGVNWFSSPDRERFSWPFARRMIGLAQRLRPYFNGDYVAFEFPEAGWWGYQLHRPETGDGAVVVFRLPDSATARRTLPLRQIDPAGEYQTDSDGVLSALPGKDLQCLQLTLPQPRTVRVIFYRQL